ncbi:MAG: Do family serine endopeptidase [Spirochaetia bacterium]|nr:Do family serine endopeptidase [Spirochaetia bacterium]
MNLKQRLSSGKLFVFNLVMLGIVLGAALTLMSFSCASPSGSPGALRAETPALPPPSGDLAQALAAAESIQRAFNYVADTVKPSVVELDVVETLSAPSGSDDNPFRFFFGPPEDGEQAPREFEQNGLGSGVIVRRDRNTVYVLTNNHVVGAATRITVKLHDEREFEASVVGTDERRDLALVKFETSDEDISVARLGDSSTLRVGDWAIAIGSPLGYFESVTAGIVSALGRSGGPDGNISDFIQTDAAINRGNSGGALVNIRGEVIGINTWIASNTGGSLGLGFSIPINNAKRAIDDFISKGKVEYGWLGVLLREIDKPSAASLALTDSKGAFVGHVFQGSPADKAGLLPGDFVIALDGSRVSTVDQLVRAVGDIPAGQKAAFTVLRDGKRLDLEALIEKRDDASAADYSKLWPGLDVVAPASPDVPKEKAPKDGKGAYVVNVLPRTPAAIVELKPGDLVVAVNEKPVDGLASFYRLLNDRKEQKVSFTVVRDGATLTTLAFVRK